MNIKNFFKFVLVHHGSFLFYVGTYSCNVKICIVIVCMLFRYSFLFLFRPIP